MISLKRTLLLVLLAALALSIAACGGDGEDTPVPAAEPTKAAQVVHTETPEPTLAPTDTPSAESPTDTPGPEPTEVPDTPEPEPSAEEDLDTASLAAASDLSSFRSVMLIEIRGLQAGEEVVQSIEMMVERTSEPLAYHISMSGTGLEDQEAGIFEMYLVEDTMYMRVEDQWLSLPATEEDIATEGILTPGDLLEDMCGWKSEGRTEINGVRVRHWSFTREDIEKCLPPDELADLGVLTNADGDLYISEDDNYVVQMDMTYEGDDLDLGLDSSEDLTAQQVVIHYETTNVNEPFAIELPEEALASSALPDDIPVPEDATEVTNMFGMITFTSPSSIAEVAEFYKAAMPENGWSEGSVTEMSGMHMLEYTKEGRTASLIISEGDGGETSVMITVVEDN